MIRHLDELLRDLFVEAVDEIYDEMQVRFQPPDDTWEAYVNTLTSNGQPVNALNVYLIEVRENRKLRSNQVTQTSVDGWVTDTFAPMRLDCHYLITAWSPAAASPAVEPSWDEHALLYKVAAVLANHQPLIPDQVYPAGFPPGFPEEIAAAELPTTFAPIEGFPKYAEFWGTMGGGKPWRPALQLVVTLPISYERPEAVPMVTTRLTHFYIDEADAGTRMAIGGFVRNALAPDPDGSPSPVEGAWVQLETLDGRCLQLTRTNASGQFMFDGLKAAGSLQGDPATYRLRAFAVGYPQVIRELQLPSSDGDYSLLIE